jgi:hypothetical protein
LQSRCRIQDFVEVRAHLQEIGSHQEFDLQTHDAVHVVLFVKLFVKVEIQFDPSFIMHPNIDLVRSLDILDEASIICLLDIRLAQDLHHVWLEAKDILHCFLKVLKNLETYVFD